MDNARTNTEDEQSITAPNEELRSAELAQLAADLDVARVEAAEWRDKYVRLLAEFDNFRKRVRQDMEMQRGFTTEILVAALLPIMDDLERMLATQSDLGDPYRRGAELIRDKLRAYLLAQGVEQLASQGKPFNPAEHDAVALRPTADFPPGTVLEVVTPGYRLGDRIIRHAQVVVSESAEIAPPLS